MLQSIRDRSQGLIVGVIVFLISLTFALWGIQSYVDAGGQVVVAEADGDEILLSEFQDSLQRFRRQAQSILGDSFDANAWDSPEIRQRALDELINERVLIGVIDDARIRIGDVQVARQLQEIPSFQDENGFSRAIYEQRVPLLGLSQAGFELKLREDMARAQLRAGVAASEFVTAEEATFVEQLRSQKRDIGYAIIPAGEYEDQVVLSDKELADYFEANREAYRSDEQVTLEYLEISAAKLRPEVQVDEASLQQHYDSNKASYTVEEERNAKHILVHLAQSASDQEAASALEKISAALERARDGESFETLAQEISDDVGSSADGGETGFFPRGAMAPEFEEAAFTLQIDEISEPIRTRFGYHIIKLKEIKPGGTKTFEQARSDVEAAYREAEAQKLFFEQAEQFSNFVYEFPDSLEVAADSLSLVAKRTAAMSRADIADEFSEKLATTAFEPEVLLEGLNAEPVELSDGRLVAVRVVEHQPSSIPDLADVRGEVESSLRTERIAALTKAAGNEIIERMRAGVAVDDVIAEAGLGWEQALAATRESDKVNRAVLRAAFRAEPGTGEAIFSGVAIGQADYAVMRISNVVTPPVEELEVSDVAGVRNELINSRVEVVWREFVDALRADSDVEIHSENL